MGARVQWIFDAAHQFGAEEALETACRAVRLAPQRVIARGVGGDEFALSARELPPAYDMIRAAGLHAVAPAGEIVGHSSVVYSSVRDVCQGKFFVLDLDGLTREGAEKQVERIGREVPANPVIEPFRFEIVD